MKMIVWHCRDKPKEWYSVYLVINHEARFLCNFIDKKFIRIFLNSECYRMFQDDDYENVDYSFEIVKKNQDGSFYSYLWFDVYKALREKKMFEYVEYIEEDTSLKWSLDCVPDSYRKGVLSIPKMFRCDLSKESLIQLLNDFSVSIDDNSINSSRYGFFLGCRDGIAYWLLNGKPLNDDDFSISSFSSLFINSLSYRKG